MVKMSIRYKVTAGFVLLVLLLVVTMVFIYRGVQSMTVSDDFDSQIAIRRRITNGIINELNHAEIVGQTIAVGQVEKYSQYKKNMSNADVYIDSLRRMTDDTLQLARLDTVAMLIAQKDKNMRCLMAIIRNDNSDDIYRKEIEAMILLQDSLAALESGKGRIVVQTTSTKVPGERKSFFRRVREVFSPSLSDSTVINDTIYEIPSYVPAGEQALSDTIADILKDMQLRVSDSQRERMRKLNWQMQSLSYSSLQLNGKVQQLLNTIEDESRRHLMQQSAGNDRIRRRIVLVISCIALLSLLLAAVFLYFIWRDITRSNHYRTELENAKRRAEELLDAKEKLMLTITHDIKSPVGAILGYVELLDNITTGDRQRFYLHNMQGSANHLLSLVTSLLDFHRLDADKIEKQSVPFNAKELFGGILGSFLPQATEKGLTLSGNIDDGLDAVFVGDPLRIRQVAENLLSNALKFTSEGGVQLTAESGDGMLSFSVRDSGCGMTPQEQELIYKEFMRLPNAQGKEGFGLGLAITNKLVQLLGGTIWVESSVGEGTEFHVTLPVEYSGVSGTAVAPGMDEPHAVPAFELLLIDDDRLQLEMTASLLEGTSVSVVCCTHPDEFFLYLQQKRFDVVVTDIQMPAMNGIELIAKLHGMPGFDGIPVIAMTARSDMDNELLSHHGFAACLHKPFTRRAFLDVLSGLVPAMRFDFEQLTAFAADDAALAQIMGTFIAETRRKRDILHSAMVERDIATVTQMTHQLLPVFSLVGANQGKEELEWFESRRGIQEYPAGADEKIILILGVVDRIVAGAEAFNKNQL